MEEKEKEKEMSWEEREIPKGIGCILLIPAVISVIAFLWEFITGKDILTKISYRWVGDSAGTNFGQTSALPFYFGLMAIAGAYLIKDREK